MTGYVRAAAVVAGVLSAGLLAAGCGSTSTSPAAAPASTASSTAPAAAPSSAAVSSAPPSPASATSPAAPMAEVKIASTSAGTVLVDSKGFTLYWFSSDTATTSACTGGCAQAWPPLEGLPHAGSGATGKLGTIKRSDGSLQVTWNGHPLYTFAGDKGPGELNGNSIPGWHAAVTMAAAPPPAPSMPAPATTKSGGGYGY